jgi:hypothetical protein
VCRASTTCGSTGSRRCAGAPRARRARPWPPGRALARHIAVRRVKPRRDGDRGPNDRRRSLGRGSGGRATRTAAAAAAATNTERVSGDRPIGPRPCCSGRRPDAYGLGTLLAIVGGSETTISATPSVTAGEIFSLMGGQSGIAFPRRRRPAASSRMSGRGVRNEGVAIGAGAR